MNLPPHPRLLFSAADVAAMRRRLERAAWARTFYEELKARGDAWRERPVELPPRGGQWWHWYACPEHGTRLRTEGPSRHVCPTGGEVFSGYPYDDVVISRGHDDLAAAARDLGLLFHVSGDARYAAKAREILLAYAERYLAYPLHDKNGEAKIGGGHVLPQTLDESIWLIAMAQGADAVWDTLSNAERAALKERLFLPAVETIRAHRMKIHNIQCWKNAAVGLVGLLFGDAELVADAVDSEHGYHAQMAQGVSADGTWFEGAWGYHFYTMNALRPLAEAAFHNGLDLYGDAYKRMFLAPLDLAMPDGRLPAFNDSGSATALGNPNYEIAFARYGDARLALPLATGSRSTQQAFLAGVEELPPATAVEEPSRNFPAAGYAVLRAGAGAEATWLCLKYGPHGGGHGHPDKNHFVLYGAGRVLAGDPGTAAYGVPVQAGWYRTTLAHNTLIADQASQQPATGALLAFRTGDGWSAALTDAGAAIPGLTFRRAVFLLGEDLLAFLDMVHAEDGAARLLDLALHPAGAWAPPPPGEPAAPPDLPGYAYLRDLRIAPGDEGLTLAVDAGDAARTSIAFAASADTPTEFWTATGIGANTEDRVPILIARRRAASTCYAWALGIHTPAARARDGSAPAVTPVPVTSEEGSPLPAHEATAAEITWGGAAWLVVANPGGRLIQTGRWSGTEPIVAVAR